MTDDLDPITARAVEILTAADVVAAESLLRVAPARWWRFHRGSVNLVVIFMVLVLLAVDQIRLINIASSNHELQQQIKSCVVNTGTCYTVARRQEQTQEQRLTRRIVTIACDVAYPHDVTVRRQCVSGLLKALP